MHAQKLQRPVLIRGQSLLGFYTEMSFIPTETPGWAIRSDPSNPLTDCPMNASALQKGWSRNIAVAAHGQVVRVIEHVCAVRTGMGLYDGVAVTIPSHGVPYSGHSGNFLEALRSALSPGEEPRRFTVARKVESPSPNGKGIVTFESGNDELVIEIVVDYGGTAKGEYVWRSSQNTFDEIAGSRGELKPHLRPLVYFVGARGWPHRHAFADRRVMPESEWINNIVRHRAVDAHGALGFVTEQGKLCGTYRCVYGGHREDVLAVREMAQELVEI